MAVTRAKRGIPDSARGSGCRIRQRPFNLTTRPKEDIVLQLLGRSVRYNLIKDYSPSNTNRINTNCPYKGL